MRYARVVGRVFCTRKVDSLEGKRLLLIEPLDWESRAPCGDPLVAADITGSGSSEPVMWVAARDAAVAFPDNPPVDATVVAVVEGHQVKDFRKGGRVVRT
ncbi:MAG: EutN/CcmL family microcompartment protein [Elusimicrobiota bacterium]